MTSLKRLIICVVVWVAAASAGCTSIKAIHPAATPTFGSVQAGDTVLVEMRDGRRARFVVQQVDGDAIVSKDGLRYARADIAQLQRQSVSTWKTALLVAAAVFAALYVFLAANLTN